ncbi:MAG TPA: hypothetical protein VKB93_13025 [Thermoanaerobaculia bacterium]|nr:hypothetical protein [Thermoanaerobaculia bacterium]
MTGLAITLLWFPLLGAAFSRLTGRTSWFLAGAGVNGVALFIAGTLHIPLKPVIAVLGLAAIFILMTTRAEPREHLHAWPLWITAAILLIGAIITPVNDYDGRAFWLLKAKAIAHEQRIDGPFFQLQTTHSPRNGYPLLVPLDAATVMMFARDDDDRHTRAMYAMFAIALAFELKRRFADWFSPVTGVWLATLLLLLPQVMSASGGARSAGCDIPLAAFAGCAFFELIEGRGAARFGLWLACLALIKPEGLPFALVFFAAGIFVFRKRVLLSAIPFAVALAALFAWRARIPSTDDPNLFALFTRLPQRLAFTGEAVREFLRWFDFLWIAVVLAIAWLAIKRAWRPLALGLAAIAPMLALYLVAYIVTDWSIAELVRVTATRLLSHFVAPALFLVAAALHVTQSRA